MRPPSIYSAQKFNKNRFFKKRLALHRFILLSKYDVWSLRRKKFQMGYKIRTSEVQIFVRCKRSKWGTVPPNGVRLATLMVHYDEISSFVQLIRHVSLQN